MIGMPNGWIYTGITIDIDKRIKDHSKGRGARCLKGKGPLKLLYVSDNMYNHKTVAALEYSIKHKHGRALKNLIVKNQPKDVLTYVAMTTLPTGQRLMDEYLKRPST